MQDRDYAPSDISCFHRYSGGKDPRPIDTIDELIVQDILRTRHLFVCGGRVWLYESGCFRPDETGTKTKSIIRQYIYTSVIRVDRLNRIYNLMLANAEIEVTIDQVNQYPPTWINFKNCMLDVLTFEQHPHDPAYRCINQIPHAWTEWKPDEAKARIESSLFDRYIKEWIPSRQDRQMLLEYSGYCLTRDTRFQKFLTIAGDGDCGKSTFLRLLQYALGTENCSALPLQRLAGRESRFQTVALLGKLANICADLTSTALEDTAIIKTIIGEDLIVGEYKGGAILFFQPYAKFIFSANRIPAAREDVSGGYFRRLLILRVWKRCADVPNLEERLREDVDVFIHEAICALHDVFVAPDGTSVPIPKISESPNSKKEVDELRMFGDSVQAFLYRKTRAQVGGKVEAQALYSAYCSFCFDEDRSHLMRNTFYQSLLAKGFPKNPSNGKQYISGLVLDEDGQYLTSDEVEEDMPF